MKNKKAVATFWWVFIVILAVVVFMGVYILFSGTYINDFWRNRNNQGDSPIEAGKTPWSSNTGSGTNTGSNGNTGGSIFNRTNASTMSNFQLSFLPSPPSLPS